MQKRIYLASPYTHPDERVRAFRIMVNRSATWAEWDDELLLKESEPDA